MKRLQESFRLAWEAGYRKFVMFLHYPPTNILETERAISEYSIRGNYHGINYMLVSGDYLNFRPAFVLN